MGSTLLHKTSSLLRVVCMVVLLALPSPARAAADGDLAGFVAEVEEAAAEVHSLSCLFVQERHLTIFAQPVVFQGALDLVRPDQLRWEFTEPVPSVLVFDGKSGLRCSDQAEPRHFDLNTDPIMRMVAQQLWTWLDGKYGTLAEQYKLQLVAPATISIVPRDKQVAEFIDHITIFFDPASKQPRKVEIAEPGGDLTRLLFRDYQLNPSLQNSLFSKCERSE
ncbi:MAG: outer membrane lipoprotein carrier protein LolA [Desulfobulbaceae bacterium]|nr:outer membrane lipoprotein carrier protein LolA [Desulfobulbaceae bacterium]